MGNIPQYPIIYCVSRLKLVEKWCMILLSILGLKMRYEHHRYMDETMDKWGYKYIYIYKPKLVYRDTVGHKTDLRYLDTDHDH